MNEKRTVTLNLDALNAFVSSVIEFAEMPNSCYNCDNYKVHNIEADDAPFDLELIKRTMDSTLHGHCHALPSSVEIFSDFINHYCSMHKRVACRTDIFPTIIMAAHSALDAVPVLAIVNDRLELRLMFDNICDKCNGDGGSDMNQDTLFIKCDKCNGSGEYDHNKDSAIPSWRRDE